MYFLFSGEGGTDLGVGISGSTIAEGKDYLHGPMTLLADRIVEEKHRYSLLESECCGYLSESEITKKAKELKAAKKSPRLPGRKQPKETLYYFKNARILAMFAKKKAAGLNDTVVAILFRDADGTASSGRGEWRQKWESMMNGFAAEGFDRGVPMIPKPKSEAWILCALKQQPYQDCGKLEDRSGNDQSPNSLKNELNARLAVFSRSAPSLREHLCHLVEGRIVDLEKIEMPSFKAFRDRLEAVIG
jgi:hypothetical protein